MCVCILCWSPATFVVIQTAKRILEAATGHTEYIRIHVPHIYIYEYIYMYICMCTYEHTYELCIYAYMYICIYVYTYTYSYISIHPSIHPSIHSFIHSFIHAYIYDANCRANCYNCKRLSWTVLSATCLPSQWAACTRITTGA